MTSQPHVHQSGLADSRANQKAKGRLVAAGGSVYEAFDRLGCGIDHQQMLDYLAGSLHFQTLPEDQRGKVAGLVMGTAFVESEREVRRFGRWFR
jgi:hypothetical protein